MIKARKEEGIGRGVGGDGLVLPDGAAADGRTETIKLGGVDKPQVGLGLAGAGELTFGAAFVEEFAFGGVVGAEDDLVAPAGEVADDL